MSEIYSNKSLNLLFILTPSIINNVIRKQIGLIKVKGRCILHIQCHISEDRYCDIVSQNLQRQSALSFQRLFHYRSQIFYYPTNALNIQII